MANEYEMQNVSSEERKELVVFFRTRDPRLYESEALQIYVELLEETGSKKDEGEDLVTYFKAQDPKIFESGVLQTYVGAIEENFLGISPDTPTNIREALSRSEKTVIDYLRENEHLLPKTPEEKAESKRRVKPLLDSLFGEEEE